MKRTQRYTEEKVRNAVKSSYSLAQVLKKLGLVPAGGNYEILKAVIADLNIDMGHFTGQGHLKGKSHNWTKKRHLSEVLIKGSRFNSCHLRNRLIAEGIFERKCYGCNLTKWQGRPIALELEHKNGDRMDNRKENLSLLCPNCHAQTPTWRRKK